MQGMEKQLSDEAEKERAQLEAQRKAKEAEIQAQIDRCAASCHHVGGMHDIQSGKIPLFTIKFCNVFRGIDMAHSHKHLAKTA
jgi:hypothetical protein